MVVGGEQGRAGISLGDRNVGGDQTASRNGTGAWGNVSGAGGGRQTVGDGSGLNPNRAKGFESAFPRIETPRLSDMRAKQGAIVARFLTFFQRKTSLVIELYNAAFYRQKPTWDKIADFIYSDLCSNSDLKKQIRDVQFHPVKMLIFIKFSEDRWRDSVVERLQSEAGVIWKSYGVKVRGYSLDAEVKFFRLLGVSPETNEDEIKKTFHDLGIGEVVDIKKGLIDEKRLPGVTNGTWSLRVKILDQEKIIPSYIHRRDEGELWSLNFEGRVFCCWKCGDGNHIGDKCRDQTRTFDEVFNGSATDEDFVKPTWAAVVRTGNTEKEKEMENRVKAANKRKSQERKESKERKQREEYLEREKHWAKERKAIEEKEKRDRVSRERDVEKGKDDWPTEELTDKDIVNLCEGSESGGAESASLKETENKSSEKEELEAIELMVKGLLEDIVPENSQAEQNSRPAKAIEEQGERDLSFVFGAGASKLGDTPAINAQSDSSMDQPAAGTSTPMRKRSRGRRRSRNSGRSSMSSPSPIRPPEKSDSKKLRFEKEVENKGDTNTPAEGSASNGELDDSGDWGSSFEEQVPSKQGVSGTGAEQMEISSVDPVSPDKMQGATVTDKPLVEGDSGDHQGP